MTPRSEHAKVTVFATQVRSNDDKSILVESGGFQPTRWFLEHGSRPDTKNAEPPRKRRKTDPSPEPDEDEAQSEDLIPLFDVAIDLHFPNTLRDRAASNKAIASDVSFDGVPIAPVVLHGIEDDEAGSRLRLTYPKSKSPVLLVECDSIPTQALELLQKIALPGQSRSAASRAKQNPASLVSCTFTRSSGDLYNVARLRACLDWRSSISAFPAGVPVGAAKTYADYDLLLEAYRDNAREAFDHSQEWTPQDFYESVHVPPLDVPTKGLFVGVLNVELYPFQKRAVAWMMSREGVQVDEENVSTSSTKADSMEFYKPVRDVNGRACFVSHLEGIITRSPPSLGASQLSGGLLAEEMGLGKTVELMSLVSLNQRPKMPPEMKFDEYSGINVTRSRATLIITPNSILKQWKSELTRHAPHLSLYHYEGISTGNKKAPPEDMLINELASSYDIVLATYSTLSREVHFAQEEPDRSRRFERKFERKRSPLVQMEWWRVCLDEAQMVESGVTAAARVACRLPRVHSWAVSGTPLKKNIQDLHGLLIFLRYTPFSEDPKLWSHLLTNHRHLFKQIFNPIALRHTKALVREELHLPPQKRVVVTVPFSVVEQQNYTTLFEQMCADVGLDANGAPLEDDWDPEDPRTIEAMRTWLARLRQTCLHPQVGGQNRRALGRGNKPLRTVAEVLEVMIEQNETNIRTEERSLVQASLHRAHILGNNGEDERRSEHAMAIYQEAMEKTENMVKDARQRLESAKASHVVKDGEVADREDDEETANDPNSVLGHLQTSLRVALQHYHACTFFTATSYFQIKTNEALTPEGSERFTELEAMESDLYDKAKVLRKEILKDTVRKAEKPMTDIRRLMSGDSLTKMPSIDDLQDLGGIESRRIVEKSEDLFELIREVVNIVYRWREKMAEFLVKPLVDEETDGIDTTGDEYEESTKQQDELYVYFDCIKAMHADLNNLITGESTPLVDHEMKTLQKSAKSFFDPDVPENMKPNMHSPELARKLTDIRNKLRKRRDQVGSVRSLIQEARALDSTLEWREGTVRAAEQTMAKQHLTSLQTIFSAYTKALNGLEKEVELFRTTQNLRVEFYRQLQELSDDVAPFKDELDPKLDQSALGIALQKEQEATKYLAQLKTKNRFLTHIRDDTQTGPKICIICTSSFEQGVLTVCGHQYCKICITQWFKQSASCPTCKTRLTKNDIHDITFRPQELRAQEEAQSAEASGSQDVRLTSPSGQHSNTSSLYTGVSTNIMEEIKAIELSSSYGTKIDTIARHLHWLRDHDPGAKSIVFSQYREFLDVLGGALKDFKIGYARLGRPSAAEKFKTDPSIDCLLLDAKTDSSGLTLVNATHVFICEPLIQTAVELQAIARVHRIGQTRSTTVWMYLVSDTVEEAIYDISVTRRLAHVQLRQKSKRSEKSRSSTPVPLQEGAVEAANSEELQSAPLTKLLTAGKTGGELVGKDDLWQCLFGKAQQTQTNAAAEREVGRHSRAEAAEERQAEAGASASS